MNDLFLGIWVVGAVVCGCLGSYKRVGAFVAVVISLLLSPLASLIIIAGSKNNDDIVREENILNELRAMNSKEPLSSEQHDDGKSWYNRV